MAEFEAVLIQPVVDEGLRCLKCGYNLTGLTGAVCPECGIEVDWEEVRSVRDQESNRPGTYWDCWPWYLKPVGLVATALQIALLPWLFARRLPARPRQGWALLFAGICLVFVPAAIWWERDKWTSSLVYLVPQVTCILLIAGLFGLVLLPERVWHPFRFWLAVACYASYPIPVEMMAGSPCIVLPGQSTVWPLSTRGLYSLDPEVTSTILFYLWWLDLVVVGLVRRRPGQWWRPVLAVLIVPVCAVATSYLGLHLEQWLD